MIIALAMLLSGAGAGAACLSLFYVRQLALNLHQLSLALDLLNARLQRLETELGG